MKPTDDPSRIFIIVLFCLGMAVLGSCHKSEGTAFPDPETLPIGLAGSWVETATLTDTLVFYDNESSGLCLFLRGYEIRNGYRLPVIGSTGYLYTIFTDSITLVDGLDNTWNQITRYFNLDDPSRTFRIGHFSKYISNKNAILTFRKVR